VSQHRPEIDVSTEAYWQALADGRLVANSCRSCGGVDARPRGFCPNCWSFELDEVEFSGRATLYSFSIVHANPMPPFNDLVPYVAALVDLEEGPRIATRLVDLDPQDAAIGMRLVARFEAVDEAEGIVLFAPTPATP
jgi:uncharacterized OB-fold protein